MRKAGIRSTVRRLFGDSTSGKRNDLRIAQLGASLLGIATLALFGLGCATKSALAGVPRGDSASYLVHPSGGAARLEAGGARFKPEACRDFDLKPEWKTLDENAVVSFLRGRELEVNVVRARGDLLYLDVGKLGTSTPIRLRLAILRTSDEAGRELHEALLQHGDGAFGVHRGNLALLGPKSDPADAVAFVLRTKLHCWGVMTLAAQDDDYVIPGAYAEP